jgi:tetrahydromethanopterin S-methyltransferase subunit B
LPVPDEMVCIMDGSKPAWARWPEGKKNVHEVYGEVRPMVVPKPQHGTAVRAEVPLGGATLLIRCAAVLYIDTELPVPDEMVCIMDGSKPAWARWPEGKKNVHPKATAWYCSSSRSSARRSNAAHPVCRGPLRQSIFEHRIHRETVTSYTGTRKIITVTHIY